MGHWWQRDVVEPGKLPLLLALASFVLAFAAARLVTRLIRAGRGPFRDVTAGGLHVHHVVHGVVLTVVGGFGAVASARQGAGAPVCAVIFGLGAGWSWTSSRSCCTWTTCTGRNRAARAWSSWY